MEEFGPPSVKATTWSKVPSAFFMDSTRLMVKNGPISGKVIFQNFCQALTPSMAAAS